MRFGLCVGASVVAAANACGPFFYQAPPALDAYPERQAIRTWREIFPEKFPPPPDSLTREEVAEVCAAIVSTFAANAATLERIEKLQAINRSGDYRVRYANLLNEMRELATSKVEGSAARDYLRWRLSIVDSDDGFIRRKPGATDFYLSDEAQEHAMAKWDADTESRLSEIDRLETELPSTLAPNLAVQRGAWLFRRGEFAKAVASFDEAIAADPESGRAEVALLMQARCAIELSRDRLRDSQRRGENHPGRDVHEQRQAALALLRAYEERHPDGRFLADAIGWQGALASDSGDLREAATQYLRQMEIRPTREVIRSALRELDRCYEKAIAIGETGSLPIERIANHPATAMSLVYRCLDPGARNAAGEGLPEDYSGGRSMLRRIEERVIRPSRDASETLVWLGRETAVATSSNVLAEWKSFHLAILAWVSIESGEPEQALRLLDRFESEASPDLLMCRGIALERLGHYRAAESAYLEIARLEPYGALSVDLAHRIAVCRRHLGEAGLAIVELMKPAPQETTSFPSLRLSGETDQWIDTLLQFSPLDELEQALATPGLSPETARRVRSMIRCRAMARGDFDRAERWLERESPPPNPSGDDRFSLAAGQWLDRNRWETLAQPIVNASKRARQTSDADDRAFALLNLGDLWMRARGRLTSPSLDPGWIFESESEIADLQRRKNGIHFGHPRAAINAELDRRDEAWHALQCYLQAADCGATPTLTARALAAANECLLAMAQLTPYQATRALESDHSVLSRRLRERLTRDFAENPEAASALRYTFDAPVTNWMPGDITPWAATLGVASAMAGDNEESWEAADRFRKLRERLAALATRAGELSVADLRSNLSAMREEFLPTYESASQSVLMNDLDDLARFLEQPGVTSEDCGRYFPARVAMRVDFDSESFVAPDFPEFIRCVGATENRSPSETEKIWNDFLARFPDGPKSEAAALRALRARYRQHRTRVCVEPFSWPHAPIWNGYKRVAVSRETSQDPRDLLDAIDAYDRNHPNGRYAAESTWMRGGALIDAREYAGAMACLASILDDPSKRDLHADAALDLAECFTRLWDPTQRPALIEALRTQPRAVARLRRFIESETCGAQLRPMQDFLREEIGAATWEAALDDVNLSTGKNQADRTTPASRLSAARR